MPDSAAPPSRKVGTPSDERWKSGASRSICHAREPEHAELRAALLAVRPAPRVQLADLSDHRLLVVADDEADEQLHDVRRRSARAGPARRFDGWPRRVAVEHLEGAHRRAVAPPRTGRDTAAEPAPRAGRACPTRPCPSPRTARGSRRRAARRRCGSAGACRAGRRARRAAGARFARSSLALGGASFPALPGAAAGPVSSPSGTGERYRVTRPAIVIPGAPGPSRGSPHAGATRSRRHRRRRLRPRHRVSRRRAGIRPRGRRRIRHQRREAETLGRCSAAGCHDRHPHRPGRR